MRTDSAEVLPLTPLASDTLKVVHTRYLRSPADVTGERFNRREVRRLTPSLTGVFERFSVSLRQSVAGFKRFSASLQQSVVKIYLKLLVRWWLLWKKSPDSVFHSLQLDKVEGNLFASPKFFLWKYYVEKTTLGFNLLGTKLTFDILHRTLGSDRLVKALELGVSEFDDVVNNLRNYQVVVWAAQKKTLESLFNDLKINELSAKELFGSMEFIMWGKYITKWKLKYVDAVKLLSVPNGKNNDLIPSLAAIGESDANFEFARGLLYGQLMNVDATSLLKSWVSQKRVSCLTTRLGKLWLDHLYMRIRTDHVSIDRAQIQARCKAASGREWDVESVTAVVEYFAESAERLDVLWKGYGAKLKEFETPSA